MSSPGSAADNLGRLTMSMTLTIPRRFRGPRNSGNGGYSCGLVAAFVKGPTQVTLHQPPPLEQTLRIEEGPPVQAFRKDLLILTAEPTTVDLEVPSPPTYAEAKAMAKHFVGLKGHAIPECFVCGPHRDPGDGLRIFAGRSGHHGPVAAPWKVHPSLTSGQLRVGAPILWAALDCPGGWGASDPGEIVVLGRMAARIDGTVEVGERCVVIGWSMGRERRKRYAGTALFGGDGRLVGLSQQTWITVESVPGQ